ncbi:MAG: Lsm family RNA-binding protein [Sulfolobales archaeon]|nr:Lsm family RNA-binding protein [Sulfolobales archaeon]MDW8083003.1 Lsm family RNA-binding protein [Sulfolobales archaeon]
MSEATRRLRQELYSLLDHVILVRLSDGTRYEGRLKGIDVDGLTLHLVLEDVRDSSGSELPKVFVSGSRISEIILKEKAVFNAKEFAAYAVDRLKVRPDAVKVDEISNVVRFLDRYVVSEKGVEGSGPFAEKLYSVWQEYLESKSKPRTSGS